MLGCWIPLITYTATNCLHGKETRASFDESVGGLRRGWGDGLWSDAIVLVGSRTVPCAGRRFHAGSMVSSPLAASSQVSINLETAITARLTDVYVQLSST
jgi:hypothetical protein